MKILALLMVLAGGTAAFADSNLFKNGNFADGLSHWEGDCHTAGSASDDTDATTGVVVKLRSGEWTKISQEFDGKAGSYLLTITYTVSPGMTISQRPEDYVASSSQMGLGGLSPISTQVNAWLIFMVDTGSNTYTYWQNNPSLKPGIHKMRTRVTFTSTGESEKNFYLGFPPGSGTINFQSITLVPFGAK